MRTVILLTIAASVMLGSCSRGGEAPRRASTDTDGYIRLHPLEVRGGAFVEGFVAYEQHSDEDGWTEPRALGASDVVTLDRTSAVRLWSHPCSGVCGDDGAMLDLLRRGRVADPRGWGMRDLQFIRCSVTAVARPGKSSDLRPVIDVRRGHGCDWSGSAIDPGWCDPVSVLAGVDAVPRAMSPATLRPGTFTFVEEQGCAGDGKTVRIRGAGWSGRIDDCNSASGTWRRAGAIAAWHVRSSTTIACGGQLRLDMTEHIEELEGRYLRFRDRDGFTIAVARRA